MDTFPSNRISTPPVEPPDEVEADKKIITSEVIRRKTPLGRRFMQTFVGGNAKEVFDYIVFEIMIPSAKDMLIDSVSNGIERMLKAENRTNRRVVGRSASTTPYVSYNRISPSSKPPFDRDEPRRPIPRANFEFDQIILATRAEAQTVLSRMYDVIQRYDVVTVASLYEMVGIPGTHVDEKWGWTDLRPAGITLMSNGYLLDLPQPEPIR